MLIENTVVYMKSTLSTNCYSYVVVYQHLNTQVHIGPSKREVSHTYLLGYLKYGEKHAKYILSSCGCICCLQICNSVLNVVVMGLVLGQSLMVISTCYYAKVSPLYNVF